MHMFHHCSVVLLQGDHVCFKLGNSMPSAFHHMSCHQVSKLQSVLIAAHKCISTVASPHSSRIMRRSRDAISEISAAPNISASTGHSSSSDSALLFNPATALPSSAGFSDVSSLAASKVLLMGLVFFSMAGLCWLSCSASSSAVAEGPMHLMRCKIRSDWFRNGR